MLDYAQLSNGEFRKFYTNFNLRSSVTEIIDIMSFKAHQLGIRINSFVEVMVRKKDAPIVISEHKDLNEDFVNFD